MFSGYFLPGNSIAVHSKPGRKSSILSWPCGKAVKEVQLREKVAPASFILRHGGKTVKRIVGRPLAARKKREHIFYRAACKYFQVTILVKVKVIGAFIVDHFF